MIIKSYDDLYEHIKGVSMVNKDKIYNIMAYLDKAKRLDGNIAELGVLHGGISRLMALMAPEKKVYAFDTFEGIPYDDVEGDHKQGEFKAISFDKVRDTALNLPNIVIKKGIFPDTVEGMDDEKFCFVHMDADIYQSTKAGLEYFWPRLSKLGAIIIDDWDYEATKGVKTAVIDYYCKYWKPEAYMIEAVNNQLTIIKKG